MYGVLHSDFDISSVRPPMNVEWWSREFKVAGEMWWLETARQGTGTVLLKEAGTGDGSNLVPGVSLWNMGNTWWPSTRRGKFGGRVHVCCSTSTNSVWNLRVHWPITWLVATQALRFQVSGPGEVPDVRRARSSSVAPGVPLSLRPLVVNGGGWPQLKILVWCCRTP